MLHNVWEASNNLLDVYIAKELSFLSKKFFVIHLKVLLIKSKVVAVKGRFVLQPTSRPQSVLHILSRIIFPVYVFRFLRVGFPCTYIGRRYHPEPQGTSSLVFSLLCLPALCIFRPKQTSKQDNCANYKPFRLFLEWCLSLKEKISYQFKNHFQNRIFQAQNKIAFKKKRTLFKSGLNIPNIPGTEQKRT